MVVAGEDQLINTNYFFKYRILMEEIAVNAGYVNNMKKLLTT